MTTNRPPRPDAPPEAYECEWCDQDAPDTADGFSYEPDDPSGPWVPTCEECRDLRQQHERERPASIVEEYMDNGAAIWPWWVSVDVSTAYDAATVTATHPDHEPDDDAPTIRKTITGRDLTAARAAVLRDLPESPAADCIRRDDVDASAADVVLQVAVYGRVVYG
jgi:hypothetical protein